MSLITIIEELFYSVDDSFVPVHASRLLRCFFIQTFFSSSSCYPKYLITPVENNLSWSSIKLWEEELYLLRQEITLADHCQTPSPSETSSLKNFELMERPVLLALLNRVSAAGVRPLDDFNQLRLDNSEKRSAARIPTPARIHQSPTIVVKVR